MKTILILSARSGSKRLPSKHFAKLSTQYTALEVLCLRLKKHLALENVEVCIATTTESNDQIFESHKPTGVTVFRGSKDNIPLRQYQAAVSMKADLIVAVDGDDIFTSPEAVKVLIEKYKATENRDRKIFYTEGLPFGMNVSCYGTKFLGELIKGKEQQHLETGWGRIFPDNSKIAVRVPVTDFPDKLLRFTLDYPEDLTFFSSIVEDYGQKIIAVSTEDIIRHVLQKEYFKINQKVIEKYWENFHREKGLEENASK